MPNPESNWCRRRASKDMGPMGMVNLTRPPRDILIVVTRFIDLRGSWESGEASTNNIGRSSRREFNSKHRDPMPRRDLIDLERCCTCEADICPRLRLNRLLINARIGFVKDFRHRSTFADCAILPILSKIVPIEFRNEDADPWNCLSIQLDQCCHLGGHDHPRGH